MSTPWKLTVWLICQSGRPFDYHFSRTAAFERAKELREGSPSGAWSVEERIGELSIPDTATRTKALITAREEG